ncbi:MAG TPA: thiamine-phosphate kinase, partial [Candidatus Acidoferrales bacterium]|nr:thiamine-phosphate kinase [Candidatus Acidoferrales bacterium]
VPKSSAALRLGIGDDSALISISRAMDSVVTCDAFIENVHFLLDVHAPDSVGYKALARATSDVAAMGATPRFFLLTLALPAQRTGKWLDKFLAGMSRAAREYGLVLAGGDVSSHSSIAISITVIGEIAHGLAVTRSGARPGDLIYVSGTIGAAQLGLQLIRRGMHRHKRWRRLLRQHCYPTIRLALGKTLSARHLASAMIDVSDGLSTDLARLCSASGVGARIFHDRVPAVAIPPPLRQRGFDPLAMALHGGDDYELLFTVPRRLAKRIPARHDGVRLTPIGEITRERKILLVAEDGRTAPLRSLGWEHFRA